MHPALSLLEKISFGWLYSHYFFRKRYVLFKQGICPQKLPFILNDISAKNKNCKYHVVLTDLTACCQKIGNTWGGERWDRAVINNCMAHCEASRKEISTSIRHFEVV